MDANSPQSSSSSSESPRTHANAWFVRIGGLCLALAGLCMLAGFAATSFGMLDTFSNISAGSAPDQSEMARQISYAMIPTIATFPLALLGVVLIILGLAFRRPCSES